MKMLLEQMVDEDWKQNVAAGLLGASLLTSPAVATAANHHSQPKHTVHQYSEQDIINSIVGESSGEGYNGMLAVASAIRNRSRVPYYKRNVLQGVYGKNAKHIKHEGKEVFDMARKAWNDSGSKDAVNGAYLWGNANDVNGWKAEAAKNPKFWFNNVVQVAQVGGHYFFGDKRG